MATPGTKHEDAPVGIAAALSLIQDLYVAQQHLATFAVPPETFSLQARAQQRGKKQTKSKRREPKV